MVARAVIVMLIVLNVGVAAWWLSRPDPLPASAPAPTPGVERLRLVSEARTSAKPQVAPASAAPAVAPTEQVAAAATTATEPAPVASATGVPAPTPASASPATTPPTQPHACYSAGPFADTDSLARARAALTGMATRIDIRQAAVKGQHWDVYLPPAPDRASAQAIVQKIAAAGVQDYYVVSSGEAANSIALGRYGTQIAAQRRQQTLQAAGFQAQIRAPAMTAAPAWIDFAAEGRFDAARAAQGVAPATLRTAACATADASSMAPAAAR